MHGGWYQEELYAGWELNAGLSPSLDLAQPRNRFSTITTLQEHDCLSNAA
jgi:hypothetical protein